MTIVENQLMATREYNFPRELVFRAWTTPDLIAQWWGPEGFTNTNQVCDIKPGGTWRFIMHGPDGADYPNHNVFVEIVPSERIVLDHVSGHEFRITATFESIEGSTRVTFRQRFKEKEEFEKSKPICIEANEQLLDKLGELLENLTD
ncbi:polyketide cyclase [Paenibacillus sp. FSL A5-0031]|uniref:SRPBCC family protein n=1 Tax=Paenibacillus sp. FSL A5-0031 TaxID=1920420 RepID=UPI00096FB4BC|nr:SRPBCC family protein [Paenibacillus sp. FSL A5-0031]OME87483.1 polyketide cyclase [Paenibacillus sp. FSL A5-0031]